MAKNKDNQLKEFTMALFNPFVKENSGINSGAFFKLSQIFYSLGGRYLKANWCFSPEYKLGLTNNRNLCEFWEGRTLLPEVLGC